MGTFTYQGKDFLLNGEKFVVRSGAIHYFRIPSIYWKDRLLKLKECGFNTVETYVAWNLHEPKEGEFHFDGDLDLGKFIDTATELGLYVMVRPSPYICTEFDFGGFPAWLLTYKDIKLRCSDPVYLEKVEKYSRVLFSVLVPRLITNGGGIIALQVENEYGSFGNDKTYLKYIVDLYKDCGADCLLFTSDGPFDNILLESGTYPAECLPTVNFGGNTEVRMGILKSWLKGEYPLMCSEFWCGWFDYWRVQKIQPRSIEKIVADLEAFVKNDYSFNMYMFCGGTNFGFTNGATDVVENRYHAVVTSYDYCAPLTETGDRTEQYYAIREMFKKYGVDVPELTAKEQAKKAYGKVAFTGMAKLLEQAESIGETYIDTTPKCMEDCGQSAGYILYEWKLPETARELKLINCFDRAIVFVNGERVGTYELGVDEQALFDATICKPNATLQILVENMGRINYGHNLYNRKGLAEARLGPVTLFGCKTISLPMVDVSGLRFEEISVDTNPAFYKGEFFVDELADSYLTLDGFTKGFVLINGFNIGRYFYVGPQKSLYVPKSCLKEGKNEIIVFDSDGAKELKAEFTEKPQA